MAIFVNPSVWHDPKSITRMIARPFINCDGIGRRRLNDGDIRKGYLGMVPQTPFIFSICMHPSSSICYPIGVPLGHDVAQSEPRSGKRLDKNARDIDSRGMFLPLSRPPFG